MSDLRKLLEPAAGRGEWTRLCRTETGYRLVLDSDDDCDVLRFERHLRAARLAAGGGDDETAAAHLAAAIETYRGDLLPDDGPAEWVVRERDRLRTELIEACERLAAMHAARGAHTNAVRLLRHAIGYEPYRDALWRRLIDSLHRSGSPAAAAAAAAEYERVVADLCA
jgi:DNA-binding SARP family transcriptional activator